MNKKNIIILTMAMLLIAIPLFSSTASASSLLNYNVSISTSGEGQLYWTYGKNMEFFLCNGNDSYNNNCRVRSDVNYKFSRLIDRNIVPKAKKGWYFYGFTNRVGEKVSYKTHNITVLRVTVKGVYFYDYVLSYDNPQYTNYTPKRYEELVKNYLKVTYGTSRYRTLFTTKMYQLPKKNADLIGKFKAKKTWELKKINNIIKSVNDDSFTLPSPFKTLSSLTYKSSNSKVIAISKGTNHAKIEGEGKATITVSAPETNTLLQTTGEFAVYVYPKKVSLTSVAKQSKYIHLKWSTDLKSSGYQIQLSPNSAMLGCYKKTITSAKTYTTKVTRNKKIDYHYARIRPYKNSCGEKLYGPWSSVKKIK